MSDTEVAAPETRAAIRTRSVASLREAAHALLEALDPLDIFKYGGAIDTAMGDLREALKDLRSWPQAASVEGESTYDELVRNKPTPEQIAEACRANHMWMNAFMLIQPSDEYCARVGRTLIDMLKDQANLLPDALMSENSRLGHLYISVNQS